MAICAPICPAPTTRILFTSFAFMGVSSLGRASVEWRREVLPGLGALEGVRGAQHGHVVEPPADDLESDRKLLGREPRRHRAGRLPVMLKGYVNGIHSYGSAGRPAI